MKKYKYNRNLEELRHVASMFWPTELSEKAAELSVVPKLIETQDQFISAISLGFKDIDSLFKVVNLSVLTPSLFLKHLVVLADVGGEQLMRINKQFRDFFPEGKMTYFVDGTPHIYRFRSLPVSGSLNNQKLGISGSKLLESRPFDDFYRDVSMILIYGSSIDNQRSAEILSKCEIGNYLGKPDELSRFIKQRYIWVSRITGGAQANNLGQLAQDYVMDYLKEHLKIEDVEMTKNGNIPNIKDRATLATFDVVISDKSDKRVGLQVSFQVTTNSTIEQKANAAKARYAQAKKRGYKLAYVIDGAGNFERHSAVETLCAFSDCTVAFSDKELHVLCKFIQEYIGSQQ